MKKITLILTFSLIISLVGCSSKANNDEETKNIIETTKEESSFSETNTNEKNSLNTNDTSLTKNNTSIIDYDNEEYMSTEVLDETIVDELVWTNTNANVRSGPNTDSNIVETAPYGTKLHRIAVLDNGWSKIEYNNNIGYISSKLIQNTEIKNSDETAIPQTSSHTNELCTGVAKEIFDATNAERISAGLPPLVWSDELAIAADIRAEEIITNFSHTRPNGTKCYSLSSLVAGENIIRGPHSTGSEMVAHWMDSEGHKANILYPEYGIIGISTRCTSKGDTACQLFGY